MEPADELSKVKLNALLRLTMRYNQLVDLLRRSRLTTNELVTQFFTIPSSLFITYKMIVVNQKRQKNALYRA